MGYNTRLSHYQGHSLQPKTKGVYLPLMDRPPADHSTMLTAMLKAKRITQAAGQTYVLLTADQQLTKIAVDILWDNPELF